MNGSEENGNGGCWSVAIDRMTVLLKHCFVYRQTFPLHLPP